MSPFIANGATSKYTNYHLYSVINHYGSFEAGHYTAYCENAYNSKWYCFDDSAVKDIDANGVKVLFQRSCFDDLAIDLILRIAESNQLQIR